MRLLLDSHAILWWLLGSPHLTNTARAALMDEGNDVIVSAASAWEICTKHRIGKLPGADWIATGFEGEMLRRGFALLPITVQHAERAGTMVGDHKDPFDRMLIAQALAENLTLISNETLFDRFGVTRLW